MTTQSQRTFAFLITIGLAAMVIVFGIMLFANNLASEAHVPWWVAALSLIWNFIFLAVTMRFLWYQDQYFKVMNAFYPVVDRINAVQGMTKGN